MSEKIDWYKPTCELRFVERDVLGEMVTNSATGEHYHKSKKARVLQQLWVNAFPETPAEWRDVPLSREEHGK